MEWSDRGIILSCRKYGESSAIVKLLTEAHGVHAGMVKGAFRPRQRPVYQPGNVVEAIWKGRMEGQLGGYQCELMESLAAKVMNDPEKLAVLNAVLTLTEATLPENEPQPVLFYKLLELCLLLSDSGADVILWQMHYVWFEMELLARLGFGLDMSCCAATGEQEDLVYISPKSGRAVSRQAGQPYAEKLLPLPPFLLDERKTLEPSPAKSDIKQGLQLSGYFLNRYVFMPKGKAIPAARSRLEALWSD